MTKPRRIRRIVDKFLLTCLLRGMTSGKIARKGWGVFLLTCLLRGMTTTPFTKCWICPVSTHMPLARHDKDKKKLAALVDSFYSHASCEA